MAYPFAVSCGLLSRSEQAGEICLSLVRETRTVSDLHCNQKRSKWRRRNLLQNPGEYFTVSIF